MDDYRRRRQRAALRACPRSRLDSLPSLSPNLDGEFDDGPPEEDDRRIPEEWPLSRDCQDARDAGKKLTAVCGAHGLSTPVKSETAVELSLIHISEPTRLLSISYAVFCL